MKPVICFHNPEEENGWLSNWYPSAFELAGIQFSSLEQYMMYQKAVCFGDSGSVARILEENDPAQIKALGRSVLGYDDSLWSGIRQLIVYEGALAKFSQSLELRQRLADTGSAILAECAVHDHIWGTGLSMNNPDRLDPQKWQGQNLLGYTLMAVRNRLH